MKKVLLLLLFIYGSAAHLRAQEKFYIDIDTPLTVSFTHNPPKIGDLATVTLHLTNDGGFPITNGQYKHDSFPGGTYYFHYNAGIGSVNEKKTAFSDPIYLNGMGWLKSETVQDTFRLSGAFFQKGHVNIIIIWPGGSKAVEGNDTLDTIPHQTASFYVSDTLAGIIPTASTNSFKIYPNPARDVVNIQMKEAGEGMIRLMDMTGKLITSKPYTAKAGEDVNLPLNKGAVIPDGLYLINIESGNSSSVSKIMICR